MNVRLASYFMIAIMVVSTMWIIGVGMLKTSEQSTGVQPTPTPTDEGVFNVQGRLVYAPFDSIEDCLNITPAGVQRAVFINPQRAENTALGSYFSSQLSQFSPLYSSSAQKTNVLKAYIARYPNGTPLELHYIRPKTSDINYLDVSTYKHYTVFERISPHGYTVFGDPIVYSTDRAVVNATLDVLDTHTSTALSQYVDVLDIAQNTQQDALQLVAYTSDDTMYYMGIHPNGTLFERCTYYLAPSDGLISRIRSYAAQGLESGNFTVYSVESLQIENEQVLKVRVDTLNPDLLLQSQLSEV